MKIKDQFKHQVNHAIETIKKESKNMEKLLKDIEKRGLITTETIQKKQK